MYKMKVTSILEPILADVFHDLSIPYDTSFDKTTEYYTFLISDEDATMYSLRGGMELIKEKCRHAMILPK